MAQDSQLWAKLIAALSGDTYVSPLQQVEDPNLSDMDLIYKKRRQDALRRSMALGGEPPSSEPTAAPWPSFAGAPGQPLPFVDEAPAGRTPQPGDINVDQLSSYEFPEEGVPSGRATDKIDLPEQATADDGSYPYDYDPAEYLRNYASNMDPDKLAKIRAQAYLKGQAGRLDEPTTTLQDYKAMLGGKSSRGGGSFSQQDESPELTQRLAERDQWKEGQSLRDAEWEADLARQRRDQPGQDLAAQKMVSLKDQASKDRRNQMLEALVGDGGKIPYAKAEAARQLGLPINSSMVGSNPDDVRDYFGSLKEKALTYLSSADQFEVLADPTKKKVYDSNKDLLMVVERYDKRLADGMDPDLALKKFKSESMQYIMENGLGNLVDIEMAVAKAEAAKQAQASK